MKKVLIGLVVIIVLLAAAYFYFFHLSTVKKNDPLMAVPANAAIIFSFHNPFDQWKRLTSNDIWNYLKTNPHLSALGQRIDSLNNEIQTNETLWQLVAERPVVLSMHEVRKDEYDYLYVIDLQKAAQLNFIKDYIDQLTDGGTIIQNRDYHGSELIEVSFHDSPTRIYMNFHENLLTISTTHTLIEQSIDERAEPKIARDLEFIDVSRYMDTDQITMYLQHRFFMAFINQWFSEDESTALQFLRSISFAGMNFEMTDDHFSITGRSNIIDSIPNLLRSLQQAGAGKMRLPEIAPDNSSFFLSLGFDNASDFYTHLEEAITASDEGPGYQNNKKKLEKFLDISIEKHLLSWMDNEIGVIQLHSSRPSATVEFALAIRHKNIDDAAENLNFIKEQVRKKTPVKFSGINYKGYEINFLSVKGFFKVIFGKAFSKLERPYYTIMDDYVVFSNSPRTLGKIIDRYIDGATLNNNKAFADYMDRFDDKSSLFVYVNPGQLLMDSKSFLEQDSWQVLHANRDYIESFPMIGVQLRPQNELLTHHIIFEYMNHEQMEMWNSIFESNMQESDTIIAEETEEPVAVEDILPDDLTDKKMTDQYTNGQLKYEVPLKNGMKHGTYFEYDSLGNVTIKGRYKNDKKTGVWKYYNADGDVIRKERF